jgi:hypothetical protein
MLTVMALQRYAKELKTHCTNGNQLQVGYILHKIEHALRQLENDILKHREKQRDADLDTYHKMLQPIVDLQAYAFEKTELIKHLIQILESNGWNGLKDLNIADQPAFAVKAIYDLYPLREPASDPERGRFNG